MLPLRLAILFFVLVAATPSHAARCGGDFNTFIASVSADAQGAGISPSVVSSALSGVSEDAAVLNFDRRQRYTYRLRQGRHGQIAGYPDARHARA